MQKDQPRSRSRYLSAQTSWLLSNSTADCCQGDTITRWKVFTAKVRMLLKKSDFTVANFQETSHLLLLHDACVSFERGKFRRPT